MTYSAICMAYTTLSSLEEAQKFVSHLLEEKYIACANITPAIDSWFFWNNAVQHQQEVGVWLKTSDEMRDVLQKAFEQYHPYEKFFLAFFRPEAPQDTATWIAHTVMKDGMHATKDI